MAVSLKPLSMLPDGSFAICVDAETYSVSRTLAANTAEYINLPTGTKYVVFGASGSFRVKYNTVQAGTGAATFGDNTPNTVCQEDNPTIRYLGNGLAVTELSVISLAGCELTVLCFS
jgi:hypothetical protein